ncbi:hypothetical protein GCM10011376_28390 [Nocardioides flavus (ex Wang et al. 2016)]|uniref:Uncharacterized protein n=1 Tax=Nocardioides flavus (ex Wang et al. 2016) TaxID=2058780 RepID=A0ABQ3HPY6_9ACTN|nr:hypothetical protein [Nocardioides flavus (ex Wang et al. 2016)]GHE18229.1 hypothetical protein GCM10011376_28390 [Nocardioides flavus (ex Wang et al. 2016)]
MTGDSWGRWLVAGALALVTGACGGASSEPTDTATARATYDGPVVRPTAVPGADRRVVSSRPVTVTDDGSGAQLCFSDVLWGGGLPDPLVCRDASVAGWDWDRDGGEFTEEKGVRMGTYRLVGTFDGSTFAVEEATQSEVEPEPFEVEIPCPTPDGGWQVLDRSRVTQDDFLRATSTAQGLDDFAAVSVSSPEGEPGPRDPANTVVSVSVAGDPGVAEAAVREVWSGMLCVTEVERTEKEMLALQRTTLDLPGFVESGAGDPSNRLLVTVFHDDGRIQQWVDREFGEGVVVVDSVLRPVG